MKLIIALFIAVSGRQNEIVPYPTQQELDSRPNATTPLNATITDRKSAPACWLQQISRGAPHLPLSCQPGYQRSGMLCYKPCEQNRTAHGPFCSRGLNAKFRGFGKPLGCNQTWADRGGLLCYKRCPAGFMGDGLFCRENCPPEKPFKCGLLCTLNQKNCTSEILQITQGGLGIAYGLGTLAISVLAVIGTSGMAAAIGGLGLAVGSLSITDSAMQLASELVELPFCYDRNNKTAMFKVLDGIKQKYESQMNGSCEALQLRQKSLNV